MLLILIILGAYTAIILIANKGYKVKPIESILPDAAIKLSIVIPFRNEENKLEALLQSIVNQNYKQENYELILVNDHSEDSSLKIIDTCKKGIPLTVIELSTNQHGKKAALELGIKHCRANYIIFSDADCVYHPFWLLCIASEIQTKPADLYLGKIDFKFGNSLLEIFQKFELSGITFLAQGLAKTQWASLANGAFIVIKKSLIQEITNAFSSDRSTSGDDVFLLHNVKKRGAGIEIINFSQPLVTTSVPVDANEFWHQRIRWGSKSLKYTDKHVLMLGGLVFIAHSLPIGIYLSSIISSKFVTLSIWTFVFKVMVDSIMLKPIKDFTTKDLISFFVFEFILPLYTIIIAVASLFSPIRWKGRSF